MAAYGSDTAIHADPNEGPMFGAGYDLKIVDQPGDSSKDNTETASNTMGLGMSYKCPCTAGDAGCFCFKYFDGDDWFVVADYEVFALK